ncbi:MAG: 2-oxoacid:acceptor oxidoreductase subunit alpha [Candidatus Aenigmarchaeota archaeon]|nr:2-oxoacid:acceptor oxidoreductase subunit alpha [Candidatus Aenigmarchaeota archaeon]
MNRKINDFTWKIAGVAGDGILSAGLHMFAKTALRSGLYVFSNAEYPSLIRGGHNHLDVRVNEKEVHSHSKFVDLLVALNQDSIDYHIHKISENGGIVYDLDQPKIDMEYVKKKHINLYYIPLLKLATECGGKIMRNTVAIGASFGLLDFDVDILDSVIKDTFGKKGEVVVENNIKAARAGYDYAKEHFSTFGFKLEKRVRKNTVFLSGNEAITAGAIKAGCKFYSAYPMTPASSILSSMASQEKNYNIVVKHTEDEISAINMAIGASYAGVRSMTGTSGGGFALMVEGFGLASITETPLVVVEAQRPGPGTGMATHTGQADLRFIMHASTDEAPRIIIAPGDIDECFYETIHAFNLADKYQMAVVILTDKYLGESYMTTHEFNQSLVKIDRGKLLTDEQALKENDYRRYKVTADGVSSRTVPGQKNGQHVASSYEHDEYGFEREEEIIRMAMHDKRFRKLDQVKLELKEPELVGEKNADITIIGWGSTKGPVFEAIKLLKEKGLKANYLQIKYLIPFHTEKITKIMKEAKLTVCIEGNKLGQLAGVIKEQNGMDVNYKILKYDGRPFAPEDIAKIVESILQHKAEKIIVLNGYQEAHKTSDLKDIKNINFSKMITPQN